VLLGDARAVLVEMPEHSVDMICGSPPFYGLRRYLCEPSIWDGDNPDCQHEWGDDKSTITIGRNDLGNYEGKHSKPITRGLEAQKQIQSGNFCLKCHAWRGVLGNEPTPDLYIQHLVGIFELARRVLKPTGTMFINLADSYNAHSANSKVVGGFTGKAFENNPEYRDAVNSKRPKQDIPDKSLIGIPYRFALAMIDKGFILRNDIAWWKRSCMPQSVKDRFTNDWEHIFMFSLHQKYYFEQQFETIQSNPIYETSGKRGLIKGDVEVGDNEQRHSGNINYNPLGRNARTVWHGNEPLPYRLKDGIPKEQLDWLIKTFFEPAPEVPMGNVWDVTNSGTKFEHYAAYPTELCRRPILAGCPVGGVVLDPFSGTGSTGAMAKLLNRKSILIEISEPYCRMAVKRLQQVQGVQNNLTTWHNRAIILSR